MKDMLEILKLCNEAAVNMSTDIETRCLNRPEWKTLMASIKTKTPQLAELFEYTFKAGINAGLAEYSTRFPEVLAKVTSEIQK